MFLKKYYIIVKWREILIMATHSIDLTKSLKLTAPADRAVRFTPYKENFVTTVPAGKSLCLKAKTVGQYFYYVKQGFVEGESGDIVINVPATITITNRTDKTMNFIPYRENFQMEVAAKDIYTFEVDTAGQVLYYLAQDTTGPDVEGGLDVAQAPKA